MGDVESLESMVGKFNQTSLLLKNHFFTFTSAAIYHAWLKYLYTT